MTTLQILILCAAALAAAGLACITAVYLAEARARVAAEATRAATAAEQPALMRAQRVAVHQKKPHDDRMIVGVVVRQTQGPDAVLTLEDAAYVTAVGETEIPTRVHVFIRDIAYLQDA